MIIDGPSHWLQTFRAPDRRPIYDWARDNIRLGPAYAIRGPVNLSSSRHLMGVLDAWQNHRVRAVNVLAPVRAGKSLILDLCISWLVVNQPGPTRCVFQDGKAARDHAEQRAIPTLKSNPDIARYLPENADKDRAKEIIFPTMVLVFDGPALGQLQSRGYRYVFADELHLYKPGILAEAKGRLGDFAKLGLDKLLCLSQASDHGSDWHLQYTSGVLHEWHIQCQKCGHFMEPKFKGVRSDGARWGLMFDSITTEDGLFDVAKTLPSLRFECEVCGHAHVDSAVLKSEWNRTGKYVAETTDKNPDVQSFHWSALVDWPWAKLAELYLGALNAMKQGSIEPLRAFIQKYPAEFWSDAIAFEADSKPQQFCDPIVTDWEEEAFRFMTIDQQIEDVQWFVVRAWSKTGESRRLDFGKLYSTDEARAKQLQWKVRDNNVLKDSGYDARRIYAECCRYGWIALKGEDAKDFLHPVVFNGVRSLVSRSYSYIKRGDPERGTGQQGSRFARLILWSNYAIGDRLAWLKSGKGPKWSRPAPRTPEEAAMEKIYERHIAAQYKRHGRNKKTGRVEWYWYSNGEEHLDDCERMQVAGAVIVGCLPDLAVSPEILGHSTQPQPEEATA